MVYFSHKRMRISRERAAGPLAARKGRNRKRIVRPVDSHRSIFLLTGPLDVYKRQIQTLNNNFHLNIKDYVTVDFNQFKDCLLYTSMGRGW